MPIEFTIVGNGYVAVAGLVFDIFGFGLLALELRRGHLEAEDAAIAIRKAFDRFRTEAEKINVDFHRSIDGVGDTAAVLRDFGVAVSSLDTEKLTLNPLRTRLAFTGIFLVLSGFVLQAVGSWPNS